jgi:hypothetical protein
VLAFLDSLGRREFDGNGDNGVDVADLHLMIGCFGGGPFSADHECAVYDIDQDGFVGMSDYLAFTVSYTGFNGDCNRNGVDDALDILLGKSLDADFNGIPDECSCPADFNGDLEVNGLDLGILLVFWSTVWTLEFCLPVGARASKLAHRPLFPPPSWRVVFDSMPAAAGG